MSQTNKGFIKGLPKIEVRQKAGYNPSKAQTGATTEVYMDGQLLRGISFFKFEVKAAGVAKVYMEMFADVDIEAAAALPHKELKNTGYETITSDGRKAVGIYELGSYSPKAIAMKPVEEAPGCSNAEADKKPFCDGCGCGKKAVWEKKNV